MRSALIALCALTLSLTAAPGPRQFKAAILQNATVEPGYNSPRGATPQLTVIKHLLRTWVESRLSAIPASGNGQQLMTELNGELKAEDLICSPGHCPEEKIRRSVTPIGITRSGNYLIVRFGVGIECGFDDSAYLYLFIQPHWTRVWQTEQNNYSHDEYKPQELTGVSVSSKSSYDDTVVATLGNSTWCNSAWKDLYYRAYRLGPNHAFTLLDREESVILAVCLR